MADSTPKWPFGDTDGGPDSRPLVVDLENVLVAIVADTAAGEGAVTALHALGFTDENLRLYTSDQILAYDEAFRSSRSLTERVVGALVDDADSMAAYVAYAHDGCAALWIKVEDSDGANRVVRHLADHQIMYLWFHGSDGLVTMHLR